MSRLVEWSLASGPPIQIGGTRLTPQCRVVALRFPFGGFVWNRPTAVVVEPEGEPSERLSIRDVTLTAQLGAALVGLLAWLILRARKEQTA